MEWQNSKKTAIQIAGEGVKQQDFSFIADRNAKWTATLEDSWAVSNKTKHCLTMQSSNHVAKYLSN